MSVMLELGGLWCVIRDGVAVEHPRLMDRDMRIVGDEQARDFGHLIPERGVNIDALDDQGKPIGVAGACQ